MGRSNDKDGWEREGRGFGCSVNVWVIWPINTKCLRAISAILKWLNDSSIDCRGKVQLQRAYLCSEAATYLAVCNYIAGLPGQLGDW